MQPPPAKWADLPFFADTYPRIAAQTDGPEVLPPAHHRFAALDACAPDDTRVVILGQDPYPTPGHAHGLAFSVDAAVRPLPRSLSNIFKEMQADIGGHPTSGDLHHWADQGVLLLNTALTVPAGNAGGHAKLGWADLTRQVLTRLSDRPRAFVLWGRPAQAFQRYIQGPDHLILTSAHPSPLSASRGFFGSRPFSSVNNWLSEREMPPIDWIGPQ